MGFATYLGNEQMKGQEIAKNREARAGVSTMDPYGNTMWQQGGRNYWQNASGTIPWFLSNQHGAYPGVNTLYDLLNNPGKTDSVLFNRSLSANARGTQTAQDQARGNLARQGFGGSGLGAALQAAIGQAGTNQQGQLYADEARRREDLMRQDLGLLYDFFVGPRMQQYGADRGVSVAEQQMKSQKQGAGIGALATLIAGIAGAACATAEELYGVDAEDTQYARFYMGFMADPDTRNAYGTGQELAARVRRDPALRAEVKPIFDTFVAEARSALRR